MLRRAITSVVDQQLRPTELIIIDDTRPADVDAIRRSLGPCRLPSVVVGNHRMAGASGARNAGAELATSNLLAFLDDDDEWAYAYLSEAVSLLASDDLNVVCSDFVTVTRHGHLRPGKKAPHHLTTELFLTRNAGLIGSNLVLTRQLFWDTGGFNETLPSLNDMDLGISLSLCEGTRFAPLQLPLVRHHEHGGARLSTPRTAAKAEGIRRFYELHSCRMTRAQRADYRKRAIRLWGVDEKGRAV